MLYIVRFYLPCHGVVTTRTIASERYARAVASNLRRRGTTGVGIYCRRPYGRWEPLV